MKVTNEFDYRNAKNIIEKINPKVLEEIYSIVNNPENKVELDIGENKQRNLSKPIQEMFVKLEGWEQEHSVFMLPYLKYDLVKQDIPIEIELGHERLVYADFFKFLADFSNQKIPAAIMIVTNDPKKFGHTWHNSLDKTKKKIESISNVYLVPILVIGIDP